MQSIQATTQIILSILITVFILMQAQGTGLGNTWSGGGETYHTRRGVEKVIFYLSIITILFFVLNSLFLIGL